MSRHLGKLAPHGIYAQGRTGMQRPSISGAIHTDLFHLYLLQLV
jgi:hypothetical protein